MQIASLGNVFVMKARRERAYDQAQLVRAQARLELILRQWEHNNALFLSASVLHACITAFVFCHCHLSQSNGQMQSTHGIDSDHTLQSKLAEVLHKDTLNVDGVRTLKHGVSNHALDGAQ